MRTLFLVAALLTSFTCSADEQSHEEYIKEVNKAFDRVFEATDGKTLSQQVNVLKELSVEFADNEAVYDMLLQERGTTYSFIGQHQQALAAFDKRNSKPKNLYQEVKSLSTQNAVDAIVETSGEYQILMINEAHHVPQHRVLTYRLLKGLWEQGYRYLALEALSENAENELAKDYVSEKSGFYTVEPVFANLLVHAQQLGFQLVSYDYGSEMQGGTEAREKSAAKNLREKIFDNTPDAKVIIHVGYNHINEDGWLAYYLKESLELDPLTINQTEIAEKSEKKFESETYTWLVENHSFDAPVLLMDSERKFWSSAPEKYDVNVIWPRTEYSLNRPDWARLGRELMHVDISWCGESYPCTVQVYRLDGEDEVPTDRIVISTENEASGIFISPSSSQIKITNAEGEVLHTELLK
ncbi:hypothetical protein [Idiomarina ramblicola]|uniref:Haem-binding uptake Tiki superfamily ChaN domain-containing protein n=1 Tax=Idiomarina ramblicola TaxID=263724 RepID=A0A432Z5T7_9GAMM|nr:hypothetical protein [Idiomarina ramblicola]RUO73179.1 hypothetical protein CWI78_01685 [Idiomarina ramblicola]